MSKNKNNFVENDLDFVWEDFLVILIALEDHQAVLNNRLQSAIGNEEKFLKICLDELNPLRRKLHAMRDALDE